MWKGLVTIPGKTIAVFDCPCKSRRGASFKHLAYEHSKRHRSVTCLFCFRHGSEARNAGSHNPRLIAREFDRHDHIAGACLSVDERHGNVLVLQYLPLLARDEDHGRSLHRPFDDNTFFRKLPATSYKPVPSQLEAHCYNPVPSTDASTNRHIRGIVFDDERFQSQSAACPRRCLCREGCDGQLQS